MALSTKRTDLEIKLDKSDRKYRVGDTVSGVVSVHSPKPQAHGGIKMLVEGTVALTLSARSVGLFEAFYSSIKPMELIHYEIEIQPTGKIPKGVTDFPFEFELRPRKGLKLYETYHGVYINSQYNIRCEMLRGGLAKNIKKSIEISVVTKKRKPIDHKKVPFAITPDKLKNVRKDKIQSGVLPDFEVEGHFDQSIYDVESPFTGEVTIKRADTEIKSIELQFVRIETIIYAEQEVREATEVQNIQIADGDVVHGLPIPIYMVFPRLFTCVTTQTKTFKVQFEINLVILFKDGYMVTENFPIKLVRDPINKDGPIEQDEDGNDLE